MRNRLAQGIFTDDILLGLVDKKRLASESESLYSR